MRTSSNGSTPGLITHREEVYPPPISTAVLPPFTTDVEQPCLPSLSLDSASQAYHSQVPLEGNANPHSNVLSADHSTSDSDLEATRPQVHEKDEVTYPEGGQQAWLVVIGSLAGMTACFGYMNT
nr:riboflavin transporter mch5 [Quercus suber]